MTDNISAISENGHFVDESQDISSLFWIGVPFIVLWLIGIAFVAYQTDDDGYLTGVRRIESIYPRLRIFWCVLIHVVEGGQIISTLFTPATLRWLMSDWFRIPADMWLWNGEISYTFPICVFFQLIWMIFFIIPFVLWFVLKRETFKRTEKKFTTGMTGLVITLFQDCFITWVTLPMLIQILRPIPCTYYLDNAAPTAINGEVECGSSEHLNYAITGGVVFILTFMVGVCAGAFPPLVKRYGDFAINGRYMSLSFALKSMMAVIYVVYGSRHEFFLTGGIFIMQIFLVFISITQHPCLVERINFHRSGTFVYGMTMTIMCITASGLADPLTLFPFIAGFLGLGLAVILIILKYYTMTCGKLFPQILVKYVDGTMPAYEGDLCLGRNLPHGYGKLRWEDKTFTGKFWFGKENGYGVLTLGKYFYEGNFKDGMRNGFGMTNMLFVLEKHENDDHYSLHEDPAAESYEGFWLANVHEGEGTKKFRDGDRFDGTFHNGNENGRGVWTTVTANGIYVIRGDWENGIFVTGLIDPNEQEYEGDLRYGVPHGTGSMRIGDDLFEGEWRGGRMHGFGIVRMQEGVYEGNFYEGMYSDVGKWSDEHGVYVGRFKEGQKYGHGVEETPDGTYEGHFEKGCRHGYGTFRYNEREYYQGTWRRNEYHGCGLLVTEDFEYDGQWVDGRKEGSQGNIRFSNGIEYSGGWLDDKFEGQGRLRIPELGEYQGRFVNGNKTGQGRLRLADGSEYIGEWDHDMAHGQGRFTFISRSAIILLATMNPEDKPMPEEKHFIDLGGEYNGSFEEGEMSGDGTCVFADGSTYVGDWKASIPHGAGVLTMIAGGDYDGEWVEGRKEGVGIMKYPDDRVYEGEWLYNKRHGHGVLHGPNGDVLHDCEWVNDTPIVPMKMAAMETTDINIPAIDIDEFLRAIMPNVCSSTEIDESRERKRIDLEENAMRFRIAIFLNERLARTRLIRAILLQQHNAIRISFMHEQTEVYIALQKSTLAKVLNVWKVAFRTEVGRDPKKSDIVNSHVIAIVYKRYMELTKPK